MKKFVITMLFLLVAGFDLFAQTVNPRNLPLETAPDSADILPLWVASPIETRRITLGSLRSEFGAPTFNVKSSTYGALGNNSNDDTAEIQAAITAACLAGGAVVWLPAGIYRVSSVLTVPCAGVALAGEGMKATTIRTTSSTANIVFFGTSPAVAPCGGVRDMSFDSTVTRTAGATITVEGCGSGYIQTVRIHPTGGDGLVFSPTNGFSPLWHVLDSEIYITGAFTGIKIQGGNDRYIYGNWIQGNLTAGSKGIDIQNSGGEWITDTDVVLFEHGVVVAPGNGQAVFGSHFLNLLSDSNGLNGFRFAPTGTGTINGITLNACWTATNGNASASGRGIYINGGDGYIIKGIRNGNNGGHGIEVAAGTNIKIEGGYTSGNSASSVGSFDGIAFTGTISKFDVIGVTSGAYGSSPLWQRYGVSIAAGSDNYLVANNHLESNLTAAVLNTPGLAATRVMVGNLPFAAGQETYVIGAGVAGGQTVTGGTAASENLTLSSTSHATKGKIFFGSAQTSGFDGVNERIGIGTSSPDVKLTIDANAGTLPAASVGGSLAHLGNADGTATRMLVDGFAAVAALDFRRCNNTAASCTALASGDTIAQILGFGHDGVAYSSGSRVAVIYKSDGTWTGSSHPTRMEFYTTPASSTTLTERLRIDSPGHLVAAGTTPTVACTGTGTSPSVPTIAGSDIAFIITMNTGTGSPGSTGTCTVTFGAAYVTNNPVLSCMLVSGATAWGNGAVIHLTTESLTAPILTWTNFVNGTATALTVSTSYKMACHVIGK